MRDRADETGSASLIQRGRRESDSRHCCQQLTCGFLLGLFQGFLCRSLLNDPAAVHHGDLVSEVTCHSQVMRNEQICHSESDPAAIAKPSSEEEVALLDRKSVV